MRVGPVHKAVGWVLSRAFLRRLLHAQAMTPHFGPVDVWVWRQIHRDGGAVRVYAPLMPWLEEDDRCKSHHEVEEEVEEAAKEVDAAVDATGEVMAAAAAAMEEEYDCPSELPRRAAHALCPTPPLLLSLRERLKRDHYAIIPAEEMLQLLRFYEPSTITNTSVEEYSGIGMVRCLRRMSTAIRSIRSRALLSPTIT